MMGFRRAVLVVFVPLFCSLLSLSIPIAGRAAQEKVVLGGEIRFRGEGFDNPLDLNSDRAARDDYAFYRLRTRLFVDAHPRDRLRLYFRIGNEYRLGRGITVAGVRDPDSKVSLDNGYVEIAPLSDADLSFRLGRQDLAYGDGFLVFDGTPADGSSSSWFDAVLVRYRLAGWSLDLFDAKVDDEGFGTEAREEDLYGLYAKQEGPNGPNRPEGLDLYALHRKQERAIATRSGVSHPPQRTTALGGRFAKIPETGPFLAAEGAVQFGRRDGEDSRALGGVARLGLTGRCERRPTVEAGGLALSGDDPETAEFEGWDDFYAEWPKYSELLIYTFSDNTTRMPGDDPGVWTNLAGFWLEGKVALERRIVLSLRGTRLLALEATGSGDGKERGWLAAGRIDWTLAPELQAQILGEWFDPGDFYAPSSDPAWYGRWQVVARF